MTNIELTKKIASILAYRYWDGMAASSEIKCKYCSRKEYVNDSLDGWMDTAREIISLVKGHIAANAENGDDNYDIDKVKDRPDLLNMFKK